MHLRLVFLWTMIAAFVASAAIGIFAITFSGSRTTEQLLVTALLVGAFSLLGMICAFVLDKSRLDRTVFWLMWFGIASSGFALAGWLFLVWFDRWFEVEISVKFAAICTFTACWAAHLGMMSLLPLKREADRIVRGLTIACTSLVTITLILIVTFEDAGDLVVRMIGILSILAGCGTIVTPILAVVDWLKRRGTPESIPSSFRIAVQCPRCGSDEQMSPGVSTCSACGLRVEIKVQEPRCESCGYLLYRLDGDTCPECGTAIPREKQWIAAKGSSAETNALQS